MPLTDTLCAAVKRVRRVNDTWIVRGNLRENTRKFLDGLETCRLGPACGFTLGCMDALRRDPRWRVEDPKSVFYPALYCFASELERGLYLGEHDFTRSVVQAVLRGRGDRWRDTLGGAVAVHTQHKLYMVAGLLRTRLYARQNGQAVSPRLIQLELPLTVGTVVA